MPMKEDYQELAQAITQSVLREIENASGGDAGKMFKIRRYVMKRLEFSERGRPSDRKKLKFSKMVSQRGLCAICNGELPVRGAELDRLGKTAGYTEENTRLLCHECHRSEQAKKNFS